MKVSRLSTRARAIVEGAPAACGQDAIVTHVAEQLERLWAEAHAAGDVDGRERMLREQLAIARGFEQDARGRVQIIERELGELLARKGKVST